MKIVFIAILVLILISAQNASAVETPQGYGNTVYCPTEMISNGVGGVIRINEIEFKYISKRVSCVFLDNCPSEGFRQEAKLIKINDCRNLQ